MSADNPFSHRPTGPIITSFGGEENYDDVGTASETFETKEFVITEDQKFKLRARASVERLLNVQADNDKNEVK